MPTTVPISGSFNEYVMPTMSPYMSGSEQSHNVIPMLSATISEYLVVDFTGSVSSSFYRLNAVIDKTGSISDTFVDSSTSYFYNPGMMLNSASIITPVIVQPTSSRDLSRFKKTYSVMRFNPRLRRIR